MKMVNQSSRSRLDVTKSKNLKHEMGRNISSATTFKDNKNFSNSKCRLTTKGSMVVFMQEKKDKSSISSVSLSTKKKSSHKALTTRNQSCQTIDPRKCDQLFYDGVIKYPSNKILQELAEIEKQKANRLDIHVKKEFFKRNKIKLKSFKKKSMVKENNKVIRKGDIGGNVNTYNEEEKYKNNKNSVSYKNLDNDDDNNDVEDDDEDEDEDDDDYEDEDDDDDDDGDDNGGGDDVYVYKNGQRQNVKAKEPKSNSVNEYQVNVTPPPLTMCAAEIIRKTTQNINNQKKHLYFGNFPNSKGDSKIIKNSNKISKDEGILKTILDPHCPPGHIPLPDVERKKTLHTLRVSHAELVREMNRLPVRTDTLRIRQKKLQLEAQLSKIEEGIKVFNKSKVYVKIEE